MAEDPSEKPQTPSTAPHLDLDPSTLDAATVYDIDVDAVDVEKPWRQPGADITDWFNYGFDEYKWLEYATKKRSIGSMAEKMNPFAVGIYERVLSIFLTLTRHTLLHQTIS